MGAMVIVTSPQPTNRHPGGRAPPVASRVHAANMTRRLEDTPQTSRRGWQDLDDLGHALRDMTVTEPCKFIFGDVGGPGPRSGPVRVWGTRFIGHPCQAARRERWQGLPGDDRAACCAVGRGR